MKKETQYHAWYWIAAMVAILMIQAVFASYTQIAQLPYSEFQDDLKAGKVAEVRVGGNYVQGKFTAPDQQGRSEFITTRVDPKLPRSSKSITSSSQGRSRAPFSAISCLG